MKQLILLVVAVLLVTSVSAQEEYKAFKVDVGGLIALPAGDALESGAGFYIEPKYNLTDNIALGFKMEWTMLGGASFSGDKVDVSATGTYQLTGDYYFSENKIRPFVGLGIGVTQLGSYEFSGSLADIAADFGSKFGITPRAGVLLGHLRLAVAYNVITGVDSDLDSRNFWALKLGFEIGGGKK